jgi:hypothetical protein
MTTAASAITTTKSYTNNTLVLLLLVRVVRGATMKIVPIIYAIQHQSSISINKKKYYYCY